MADDLKTAFENLRISMSNRTIEDENFQTEFTRRVSEIGFDVSSTNPIEIYKVLVQTANGVSTFVNWQIDELLRILMITSEKVFEHENFQTEFKNGLNSKGFNVSDDDLEKIWEALFGAVNSSVRTVKHVNLKSKNINDTEEQLIQILLSRSIKKQSIKDYLYKPFTRTAASRLKSPEDIAKLGIKKDTRLYFVTNLIENQFSIQWDTDSVNGIREPEEFNFYRFCNVDAKNCQEKEINDKARYLKYDPRRAHVMVQLYRHCKTNTVDNYDKEQLCPPVYIRQEERWKEWDPVKKEFKPELVEDFDWMNEYISNYISLSATIQPGDLKETLAKPTLYWAVVEDTDFERGEHLQLNKVGETQVYVGISANGIRGRWLEDGSSHCRMIKKCLKNVQAMTTYEPLRLKGIQLVDARILLAKLRKEKCALFVMKTYEEEDEQIERDERDHIIGKSEGNDLLTECPGWKPICMAYGMNGKIP